MKQRRGMANIPGRLPLLSNYIVRDDVTCNYLNLEEIGDPSPVYRASKNFGYLVVLPNPIYESVKNRDLGILVKLNEPISADDVYVNDLCITTLGVVSVLNVYKGLVSTARWSWHSQGVFRWGVNNVDNLRKYLGQFYSLRACHFRDEIEEKNSVLEFCNYASDTAIINYAIENFMNAYEYPKFLTLSSQPARLSLIERLVRAKLETLPGYELICRVEASAAPQILKDEILRELTIANNDGGEGNGAEQMVDLVTNFPWKTDPYQVAYTLEEATDILEKRYGSAKKMKTEVLNFFMQNVAIGKQRGRGLVNKPLLLVGPPGIGKSSIIETAGELVNRPVSFLNLNGVEKASSLNGFARTYIGSKEGQIIQAIIRAKTTHMILGLDEIDKVNDSDILGVLLELLDPVRNRQYVDNFIAYPIDLSNLAIIATANSLDNIHEALLDRFRIVELSGYDLNDKILIAKKYIIPTLLQQFGLNDSQFCITDELLETLILNHTFSGGIRELREKLETMVMSIYINSEKNVDLTIDVNFLTELFGHGYEQNKAVLVLEPGCSYSLAVDNRGEGSVDLIESVVIFNSHEPSVLATGNIDKLHMETLDLVRSHLLIYGQKFGLDNADVEKLLSAKIHCHSDELSINKSGPSIGVAMFLSVLSFMKNINLPNDLAVTGEISLDGRILGVGGVAAKIMGAKRAGIRRIIIPQSNMIDLRDINSDTLNGMEIYPLKTLEQAYHLSFINES